MVVAPAYDRRSLTEEQEDLLSFTEGITVFKGKKGTGKTTSAVALAYLLKENFGIPVVADFPLTEDFGEYEYIDLAGFVRTLQWVTETVKGGASQQQAAVDKLMSSKQGSLLTEKVIIFDEAYEYMDSRSPMDKVNKLFGYWISKIRHFKSALILITPDTDMLDKRVNRQVDRIGSCWTDDPYEDWDDPDEGFEEYETHAIIEDIAFDKRYKFHFLGKKYHAMFDSWVQAGFRGVNSLAKETEGAEG